MKTERRHDLETNDLAVRITGWIERIKPYSGQLVGGAIALIGLAVVSSFWNSQSASTRQAAWDEFAVAHDTTDPELMSVRRVADKDEYAGTPMQEWAYATWADRQVLLASGEYLINRKNAQDRLRQVEGIYENLALGAGDAVIQNRARFGLARVYELQNKLDEARGQYSLVQGDLRPMASERAAQLDSPEVEEACAWLATAELPRSGVGGGSREPESQPDFDAVLPDATPGAEPLGIDLPDMRTLEEILGAVGENADSEDRYAEEDAEGSSDQSEATVEDDAESADSEAEAGSVEGDDAEVEAAAATDSVEQ